MLTYEDIKGPFLERIAANARAQELLAMINGGTGTYATASEYAAIIGDCLAQVLREYAPGEDVISEWDIENLIPQSLGLDHSIVAEACQTVQETLNADAGLGLRYIEPVFDRDRAYGIVTELLNNPEFVNIEDTFYDQLANFSQNVVDESIRSNAGAMARAGVQSRVIRVAEHGACKWCRAIAGNYDYNEVKNTGNDVWRRHENCRCTIDYVTSRNGSRYTERVNNQVRTEFTQPADQTRREAPQPSTNMRRLSESERNITPERQDALYQSALKLLEYHNGDMSKLAKWAQDALAGR